MPLTAIAPDLWVVDQSLRFLGWEVSSRMTIVRLPSHGLVLISPIELGDSDRQTLGRLGDVRHIIAPNLFHHLAISSSQALYPQAKVWGVAGLPQKRPNLKLDGLLLQPGSFEGVLEYQPLQGFEVILPSDIKPIQETVFLHQPSRTLIVTDIAFNVDRVNSFRTHLTAQILSSQPNMNSPKPLATHSLEKWDSPNEAAIEASVRQVLAWDFERIIPAHGPVVEADGKTQFRAGYEWFLNKAL